MKNYNLSLETIDSLQEKIDSVKCQWEVYQPRSREDYKEVHKKLNGIDLWFIFFDILYKLSLLLLIFSIGLGIIAFLAFDGLDVDRLDRPISLFILSLYGLILSPPIKKYLASKLSKKLQSYNLVKLSTISSFHEVNYEQYEMAQYLATCSNTYQNKIKEILDFRANQLLKIDFEQLDIEYLFDLYQENEIKVKVREHKTRARNVLIANTQTGIDSLKNGSDHHVVTQNCENQTITHVNPDWVDHAYPLQRFTITAQGTRHSQKEHIIKMLEEALDRIKNGDIEGMSHDDDFGYIFKFEDHSTSSVFNESSGEK